MNRAILALTLCLLATPAGAEGWRIMIEGTGPVPKITQSFDRLPVDPTPPLPPPPVVPPIVDTSPFPFPASQPGQESDQACRYFNLAPDAGGAYATLPNCRNPLSGSHAFACFTPMGMRYQGTQSIGGFRLYVPRDFPPAKIRLLCAGGAL